MTGKTIVLAMIAASAAVAAAEPTKTHWFGKKVAFLGDSITDHVTSPTNYWGYLELDLGITPYVYGISGHEMSQLKGQAEKLRAEHGDDVDAIFIFAGTNDYWGDIPLGKWYTYTQEVSNWRRSQELAPRRHFDLNAATFRGRINILLDYLKDNYPDAQIILMTPLHRGFADFKVGDNMQPEETFGNPSGLHIEDYVNVVREASSVWSVPVIDLFAESGLFPIKDSFAKFFKNETSDRLHPNSLGHRRLADTIRGRMMSMPSTFRR